MANMSYCRFENTFRDLQDCYDTLWEAGGVDEAEKKANGREKHFIKSLIDLCCDITKDFGDQI